MLEHGAYRLLLDHYYAMRQPLPGDIKILYRICRAFSPTERRAVKEILSKFFQNIDDRYVSKRCNAEIDKLLNYSKSQSTNVGKRYYHGTTSAIVTTTKEEESKKEKTTKVVQKKGERFSLETMPDDWREFCQLQRPDLNPQTTFDGFRDYWQAKPGKDATKLDWLMTWRNWVRNQKQAQNGTTTAKPRAKMPTQTEI